MNKENVAYMELARTLEEEFHKKQGAGLLANLNKKNVDGLDVTQDKILSNIKEQLASYQNEEGEELTEEEKDYVIDLIRKELWGYGLIDSLIHDKDISDIKLYGAKNIRVKRNGRREGCKIRFADEKSFRTFVTKLLERNKINLGTANAIQTFTDATQEDFILRITIISGLLVDGGLPLVAIRKIPKDKYTLRTLEVAGMFAHKASGRKMRAERVLRKKHFSESNEDFNGKRHYLGQMDLNIKSDLVWDFYKETLERLSQYGAKIIRLDAFAYAPKEPGAKNFMNEPGTWELLQKVQQIAEDYQLNLLPEIHASYEEGVYEKIAGKGYMTYDFFLPGLIIDALETGDGSYLKKWAEELKQKNIQVVNMLGCHDGIPLLDLKGLLPDERIQSMIDTVVSRGGYVKDLHGAKNIYYQVNATYYSALGEDEKKLLLARAIQMFMPGKPQVWYLDLFAGKNDYEAVERAGEGGHKEINRTNLTDEQVQEAMKLPIVQKQLELLQFRNSNPVFAPDAKMEFEVNGSEIMIIWRNEAHTATLKANLDDKSFEIL